MSGIEEYRKQEAAADSELAGWANRWQEESDLEAGDLICLLECMKMQLYANMRDNQKAEEYE